MTLKQLADKIKVCEKCRLWKNRINAVPGEGNSRAKIMFIGEGPGRREDETGRPFMGMAGVFLDQLFKRYKIKRKDVFITSAVKCRPPENRNPRPDEVNVCAKAYLYKQIKAVKPKIIVLLGNISLKALLNKRKVSELHGKIFIKRKIKYIPTFHPAVGMRFPRLRKLMMEDFKKIKELLK
ncbi:uracil-DNA glycosylase [Candidatus Woesearchaeota archaeon]|nr:uracil-DNA glycosylase [Candidatus Woesearchaeota archaeon]